LKRQWDVSLSRSWYIGPCILVGAGWWQYGNNPNLYTQLLYRNILSKKYLHSVRDQYTEDQLRRAGVKNVVTTACPSMWSLDDEFCSTLRTTKADSVVFTLTDYNKSPQDDAALVRCLMHAYQTVYFWPQGLGDEAYIRTLGLERLPQFLQPTLADYDELLTHGDVDYVGTRLHAGIRALQKRQRALIIGIDNRAVEKKRDFNLPVIMRSEISTLRSWIEKDLRVRINLPLDKIAAWKAQFN
jgi:polysaccharide pyruvyl transferase WcaK-like protein